MSDPRDIVIRPLVTEKSTRLLEQNKYTFIVNPRANKTQIKEAVEAIFKVKVRDVATIRVHGKIKRVGRFQGRTPELKKAIVTLEKNYSIPIFEGV
ncbi:MAG TPA: 50S ribosomal protein L23 [Firmicutes bacterium]|nr:50S ribosomal protein L23 [Bacillota bacterium]